MPAVARRFSRARAARHPGAAARWSWPRGSSRSPSSASPAPTARAPPPRSPAHLLTRGGPARLRRRQPRRRRSSSRVLEARGWDATWCELSSFQLEGIDDAALRGRRGPQPHAGPPRPLPGPRRLRRGQGAHLPQPDRGDVAVVNATTRTPCDPAPQPCGRVALRRVSRTAGVRARRASGAGGMPLRGFARRTLPAPRRALRGAHNRENAMAAALLARPSAWRRPPCSGAWTATPACRTAWSRCACCDGVEWIDDSKATNVDSVVKSLTAFPGNVHHHRGRPRQGRAVRAAARADAGPGAGPSSPSARMRPAIAAELAAGGGARTCAALATGGGAGARARPARVTWCCSRPPAPPTTSSATSRIAASSSRRWCGACHERRSGAGAACCASARSSGGAALRPGAARGGADPRSRWAW